MTTVPSDWVKSALELTGHFEDSNDPFGGISGDFDGMGISLGVLQWNIGMGSLQPLVRALGEPTIRALMPTYGGEFWRACSRPIAEGLTIVRAWQRGSTLLPPVYAELKRFTHSTEFVGRQVAAAHAVAARAFDAAEDWCKALPKATPNTKATFCWFFDVFTQNGGLKGLSYADVENFIEATGADRADDVICDWLAGRPSTDDAAPDARRNAALWRNQVPEKALPLLVLSYLRARRARPAYQADTLNRKATIAVGHGWVHRERHDLDGLLA
jgi:hypothetical protein